MAPLPTLHKVWLLWQGLGGEGEGGSKRRRRRDVDGGLALWNPHKLLGGVFPFTLLQSTKKKMEKSLCLLAALVFLAGFLSAALTDDALTEAYSLSNDTTTTSTTSTTVPATTQDSRRKTVTIAPSQSAGTSSGVKQSHSKDSRRDTANSKEEEESREDDKTRLGRRRIKSKGNTKLINPHYWC